MKSVLITFVMLVLSSCASKSVSSDCSLADTQKYVALLTEKYIVSSRDFSSLAKILSDQKYQKSSQKSLRKEASVRLKENKENRDKVNEVLIQFWKDHPTCSPPNSELNERAPELDV